MAFNFAALIPSFLPAISKIIDRVIPDPAAKAAAQQELLKMEQDGEFKAVEQQLSVILAEAQSKDKWTSRARPMFLYVMYGVILLAIVGGILGVWFPTAVALAATNITAMLAAIPEQLWWLFGTGYLGYTGARSMDKWKINSNKD